MGGLSSLRFGLTAGYPTACSSWRAAPRSCSRHTMGRAMDFPKPRGEFWLSPAAALVFRARKFAMLARSINSLSVAASRSWSRLALLNAMPAREIDASPRWNRRQRAIKCWTRSSPSARQWKPASWKACRNGSVKASTRCSIASRMPAPVLSHAAGRRLKPTHGLQISSRIAMHRNSLFSSTMARIGCPTMSPIQMLRCRSARNVGCDAYVERSGWQEFSAHVALPLIPRFFALCINRRRFSPLNARRRLASFDGI